MQLSSSSKRVLIIGGGISGMAAAYTLQEQARSLGLPVSFTLVESSPVLGGKIITENIDGFTIEGGPDCFLRQKPWAAQLCRQIGLGPDLIGTNDERRKVYVLNRGRLTPLPDGVMLIIPTRIMPFVTSSLISWPGKIRMGMDLFVPPRRDDGDESVGSFVRRRLGTEALEKIAEPLMSGIHVSDPEQQSLLGTFPRFRTLEKEHGSLIRGMLAQRRSNHTRSQLGNSNGSSGPASIFLSLRGGMAQLVETLQQKLVHGQILTGCPIAGLHITSEGGFTAITTDGGSLNADAVVCATPAFVSSNLLSRLNPRLADALDAIRYVSTATVSLGYRRSDIGRDLNGFGFVVPRKERRDLSACTWTSTKFNHRAPDDMVLLRCFVGGPGQEEIVERSDEEILRVVRSELAEIMGLHAQPVLTRLYRWRQANPQYDVGHLDRAAEMHSLSAQSPGLFLTGSAFEGVGIPDCIRQGQQAAEKVIEYLRQ